MLLIFLIIIQLFIIFLGSIILRNIQTILSGGDFIPTSQRDERCSEVGIEPKFVRGLRVTDADTMEAAIAQCCGNFDVKK